MWLLRLRRDFNESFQFCLFHYEIPNQYQRLIQAHYGQFDSQLVDRNQFQPIKSIYAKQNRIDANSVEIFESYFRTFEMPGGIDMQSFKIRKWFLIVCSNVGWVAALVDCIFTAIYKPEDFVCKRACVISFS